MAAVYSPSFLMQFKLPTASRTAARTGSGKSSGNRSRTRMAATANGGAAATGASPSSIAPRVPKLRDSCNACAAAKVRCTKQKPTCTRCHKSGLNCEYNATKRAGRPSQASSPSPAKVMKPLQRSRKNDAPSEIHLPSPPASRTSIPSEASPLGSPSLIKFPSMQQHTTPSQDTMPNLLASTDPTTALPSSLTAFSAEFDDFFTSLGSFPELETPTYDLLSLPNCLDSIGNTMDTNDTVALWHEENFSITDDTCSDMQISPDPHSLFNNRQSLTLPVDNFPSLGRDTPCCCLMTALGFLEETSPNASRASTQPCEQQQQPSISDADPPFPTIQSVIAQNERIVEAMDAILQCPCSHQDGYLLTVLSLVLFKILDWYTAAGRAVPTVTTTTATGTTAGCYDTTYNKLYISAPHNPCCDIQRLSRSSSSSQFIAGSLCLDGEDSGRVAAQMVLSELHRAQRLVNKLSARFKGHGTGRGGAAAGGNEPVAAAAAAMPLLSNGTGSTTDGMDVLCDSKGTWPFSSTMFDQLEADLRRRLRTVSLVIVDIIRQV